jgi:excisionase family DNA binding protein
MSHPELPLVLTVEEFAAAMRLGRGSAYEFVRQNGIRHVRCGRSIRIPRSAVLELLGETPETHEPDHDRALDSCEKDRNGDITDA